jgi:hypothetical protein
MRYNHEATDTVALILLENALPARPTATLIKTINGAGIHMPPLLYIISDKNTTMPMDRICRSPYHGR